MNWIEAKRDNGEYIMIDIAGIAAIFGNSTETVINMKDGWTYKLQHPYLQVRYAVMRLSKNVQEVSNPQ